eukprot:gb/GECG01011179.1/.p1 GENE.gb/GECG01011179.1/~~gb/GECG01011179.1/.p1  ORF type:complete len:164 (+),score=31.60 gb/GECG01011179.1/:1-492(+)
MQEQVRSDKQVEEENTSRVSFSGETRHSDDVAQYTRSSSTSASNPDTAVGTATTSVTSATERIAQLNIQSSGYDSGPGTSFSSTGSADGDSDEFVKHSVHRERKKASMVDNRCIHEQNNHSDSLADELVQAKVSLANLQEKNEVSVELLGKSLSANYCIYMFL